MTDLPNLNKPDKAAADHAANFDRPTYKVWKQQQDVCKRVTMELKAEGKTQAQIGKLLGEMPAGFVKLVTLVWAIIYLTHHEPVVQCVCPA